MASELKARIQKAMTEAMKAKDAARLNVIRLMFNGIRKKEIDTRTDITDAEVGKTLLTMLKQAQETLEQAQKVNNATSVEEAQYEINTLKEFLPEAMSEAELKKIIEGIVAELKAAGQLPAGGAGMGVVMKKTMEQVGSRAEGKVIQATVKAVLGT